MANFKICNTLLQAKYYTWGTWEKEFRSKLSKTQYYKMQEKDAEGSLDIYRLDVTFLSAILLDGRVQPEAEEKR